MLTDEEISEQAARVVIERTERQQAAFDKVWQYFVVEKHPQSVRFAPYPGFDPRVVYAFRGTDGEKCALGLFIEESTYTSKLEGFSVRDLLQERLLQGLLPEDELFCCDLQKAHDRIKPREKWLERIEENLRQTARMYRLEVPT